MLAALEEQERNYMRYTPTLYGPLVREDTHRYAMIVTEFLR